MLSSYWYLCPPITNNIVIHQCHQWEISLLLSLSPIKCHTIYIVIYYPIWTNYWPSRLRSRNQFRLIHKAYLIIMPWIVRARPAPGPPAASRFPIETTAHSQRNTIGGSLSIIGCSLVIYQFLGPEKGYHGNRLKHCIVCSVKNGYTINGDSWLLRPSKKPFTLCILV